MCARFTLTALPAVVADLFGVELPADLAPRYNVAPTQEVLAVRMDAGGRREAALLRWGLIPGWADDPAIAQKLINARAETVFATPSFRDAAKKRRCLVPADGFFEWRPEGGVKQPYWIHRPGSEPFAFAGLWERWRDAAGGERQTCAIVTTDANERLRPLHGRTPVVLTAGDFAAWLDPEASPKELGELLRPAPEGLLGYFQVTRQVGNPRFESPACVAPLAAVPSDGPTPRNTVTAP
jgi:putative SOS response-associated peptidase YedK